MSILTTTIITLNEEKFIEKCIKSVSEISDEVIVVDSGSSDATVEIAKRLGAKVFYRKFDNYASQKNFAADKSAGKWILSIDGDEILENELAKEIVTAVRNETFSAFTIPRKNIIFGKFIKYSRWQPELDRHIWLFKKDKAKWVGKVHEEVCVKGKVGRLKNAKIHYQYETITEFLEMMNGYSTIEAREKTEKNIKFSPVRLISSPIYNFLVRYFYRMGILDGWRGFTLSYLMAIYQIEVEVKIWEFGKN
jgi:glycosyltransferase involved in cell wall biosynthesis